MVQARGSGRRPGYSIFGLAGAVVFFCLSVTPSLLPRDWQLQGAISGVLMAAIGYVIGALVGLGVRKALPREPGPVIRRIAWRGLAACALVLVAAFLYLGSAWQREIRQLAGATQPTRYRDVLILLVAVLLSIGLLEVARMLRRATRWVDVQLDRWLPSGVATVVGTIVMGALFLGILHGVVYDSLLAAANRTFKIINAETLPGETPPGQQERSGGPGSLVSWASLGNKGRDFVASGRTLDQLRAFGGEPVFRPIRVYAGLESAPRLDDEAAVATKELERAGAFSRKVLCVITALERAGLIPTRSTRSSTCTTAIRLS